MRASFELKLVASTLGEARARAYKELAKFLAISEEEVSEKVSIELKVSYPKADTVQEIETSVDSGIFQVTVFGTLKQSIAKPFGM
jgi:uncharacterized protein YdbL (DUF1318 family)